MRLSLIAGLTLLLFASFALPADAACLWSFPGANKTNLSYGGATTAALDTHPGAREPSLIVADGGHEGLFRFFIDGRIERITPENVPVKTPESVAVTQSGEIMLVAAGRVYRVSPKTGAMVAIAGLDHDTHFGDFATGAASGPVGTIRIYPRVLTINANGDLLVGGSDAATPPSFNKPGYVWRLKPNQHGQWTATVLAGGGNSNTVGELGTNIGLGEPQALTATRNGGFAFSDPNLSWDKSLREVAPDPNGALRLRPPIQVKDGVRATGLAETVDGSLLVADVSHHLVLKISPSRNDFSVIGGGLTRPGNGISASGVFMHPDAVVPTPDGGFFIVDSLLRSVTYNGPDPSDEKLGHLVDEAKQNPEKLTRVKRLLEDQATFSDPGGFLNRYYKGNLQFLPIETIESIRQDINTTNPKIEIQHWMLALRARMALQALQ